MNTGKSVYDAIEEIANPDKPNLTIFLNSK
jgi:hypothetical protein